MEKKQLSRFEIKTQGQGLVTAIFSTFNVIDHDGDVVLPGAFKNMAAVRIGAFAHTSWTGALPVGKGVIVTTSTEAILEGKFFLDTTHGRDTFVTVSELGAMGEWSYSLENIVAKRGTWGGKPARIISSVEVTEVCPVLRGASLGTGTLSTKDQDFTRRELLALREAFYADEREQLQREYFRYLKLHLSRFYLGQI